MPPLRKPSPDAVLLNVSLIMASLEGALCNAVRLIEMAKEVDSEEWGQESWDANASWELSELRTHLDLLRTTGTLV